MGLLYLGGHLVPLLYFSLTQIRRFTLSFFWPKWIIGMNIYRSLVQQYGDAELFFWPGPFFILPTLHSFYKVLMHLLLMQLISMDQQHLHKQCLMSAFKHTHLLSSICSAGSGPIQLWQFLLELLTDKSCQSFISWTGDGWEFKLSDPDEVRGCDPAGHRHTHAGRS